MVPSPIYSQLFWPLVQPKACLICAPARLLSLSSATWLWFWQASVLHLNHPTTSPTHMRVVICRAPMSGWWFVWSRIWLCSVLVLVPVIVPFPVVGHSVDGQAKPIVSMTNGATTDILLYVCLLEMFAVANPRTQQQ